MDESRDACEEGAIAEDGAERLLPLEPEESATVVDRMGSSCIFDITVSSSDVKWGGMG